MKHENIAELTAKQQNAVSEGTKMLMMYLEKETSVKDFLQEMMTAQQELAHLRKIKEDYYKEVECPIEDKVFVSGIDDLLDDIGALLAELGKLDDIAQFNKLKKSLDF